MARWRSLDQSPGRGGKRLHGAGELPACEGLEGRVLLSLAFTNHTLDAETSQPAAIVLADFDGDGWVDMAVANASGNDVTVLYGRGGGGFDAAPVRPAVGSAPRSIAAGDLDGDGMVDLVVGNALGSSLTVLLNDGSGGFLAGVEVGLPGRPRAVVVGDLTGDGVADVAVALFNANAVAVLRGVGGGAFAPAVLHGVGEGPVALVAADLDGDGALDLATANITAGTVSVLRNAGAGTFAAAVTHAVGSLPRGIAAGDLDGDGVVDLVVANSFSGTVSVLRGLGGAGFAAQVQHAVGNQPHGIVVADLDADGVADIATANLISGDVSILPGAGGGVLGPAQSFLTGGGAIALAAGDVDNDTDLDLVVANSLAHSVTVLRSTAIIANEPPAIGSLVAGAGVVQPGGMITLTAVDVTDGGGGIAGVRFYRDSNGNGILDASDELLADDVDGANGWSWTGTANPAWGPGQVRYFARARDPAGLTGAARSIVVLQTALPQVGGGTVSPNPVFFGMPVTLIATDVSDADGTVTAVQFYADVNGNGELDLGTDVLLGTDDDPVGGWSITALWPSAAGPTGTVRFFARAVDNLGAPGPARAFAAPIRYRPTIAALEMSVLSAPRGGAFTLAAAGVQDFDGSVTAVSFFRDSNGNGVLDAEDQLLGTDTSADGGWTLTTSVPGSGWPTGPTRFFAQAIDNQGNPGPAASAIMIVNDPPIVEQADAEPSLVGYGMDLALFAAATDPDGTVDAVEFFRDVNGDGVVDDDDELLGHGNFDGSSFVLNTRARPHWGAGQTPLLAVAVDDLGGRSQPLAFSVQVFALPVVDFLLAEPDPVETGSTFSLFALGVGYEDGQVIEVRFYRDVDGDGRVSPGDELLGADESSLGGWSWMGTAEPAWGSGFHSFLAVPVGDDDSIGAATQALVGISRRPSIGRATILPEEVRWGQTIELIAQDVADPEDAIDSVVFYRDLNGNGLLDEFERLVPIFAQQQEPGTWLATAQVTPAWGMGVLRLFVVALDDVGLPSEIIAAELTVHGVPSLVGVISGPHEAFLGQTLTLVAQPPTGPAAAALRGVVFFRDVNGNNMLDEGDAEIGRGEEMQWTGLATPSWGAGRHTFFAVPIGPDGEQGDEVAVEVVLWTRLYLPEGWRNDVTINEYLTLTNPNNSEVEYRIIARYETGERDQVLFEGVLPGLTRGGITTTERAHPELALTRLNEGYALEIHASGEIGALLARYDNFAGVPTVADVATGEAFTSRTSMRWAFADVVRRPGSVFDFVVYYNPTGEDGLVTFTFFAEDGQQVQFAFAIEAFRRGGVNISAEEFIPVGRFAVLVESTVPLVAAQSRYEARTGRGFTMLGDPDAGALTSTVMFLDVDTGAEAATFVAVFNPSLEETASVTIAARLPAGAAPSDGNFFTTQTVSFTLAPGSTRVLTADEIGLTARSAAIVVDADIPVVVQGTGANDARGDSTGTSTAPAATGWVFADAFLDRNTMAAVGFEYLALFNPGDQALEIQVALYGLEAAALERVTVTVGPGELHILELHGGEAPLPGADQLVFFSVGAFALAPFQAVFTHWDLFQNGGWSTFGTPIVPRGSR